MEYRSGVNSEISEAHGYYGLPTLKAPVWTWEIPAYFFVGGAAGAAAVIASTARLAGGRPDLVRDARWIAAIGGAISPPLLVADLGRPERFLNMLRVFKLQSPMSVGAWTLVAFSNASAAATFCDLRRSRVTGTHPGSHDRECRRIARRRYGARALDLHGRPDRRDGDTRRGPRTSRFFRSTSRRPAWGPRSRCWS